MKSRHECCATCKFYCQEDDPENRMYFDSKSGECRRAPPRDHFTWTRTRSYHWCGEWQGREERAAIWQKIPAHERDAKPVLLYRQDDFCQQAGMIVAYWNAAFNRWHDDGERLFEFNEFTAWMSLPEPPKG
jgi:hypothetical protein